MGYREIAFGHIAGPEGQDVFRRANLLLSDVYSMLAVKPSGGMGGCNFSIALVLLCVVDGLARDVFPTVAAQPDHETRFRQLLKEKLPWGSVSLGWLDKGQAAKWLYCEFRNPLTHELGKDVSQNRRPSRQYEPVIYRWKHAPAIRRDSLDALPVWDERRPVMRWEPHKDGKRIALCGAALYWAVKRMCRDLSEGVV